MHPIAGGRARPPPWEVYVDEFDAVWLTFTTRRSKKSILICTAPGVIACPVSGCRAEIV